MRLGHELHLFSFLEVKSVSESFYGSPSNLSSTKSPVLKPAPDRISWGLQCHLPSQTSSLDGPLQSRNHSKMLVS